MAEARMEAAMLPSDAWLERQVTWHDVLSSFMLAAVVFAGLFLVTLVSTGLQALN